MPQETHHVSGSIVQMLLEICQAGAMTTSLGCLFQCSTTLSVKILLLISSLNLAWLSFMPFSQVLSWEWRNGQLFLCSVLPPFAQPWPAAGPSWSHLALVLLNVGELLAASQRRHLCRPHSATKTLPQRLKCTNRQVYFWSAVQYSSHIFHSLILFTSSSFEA